MQMKKTMLALAVASALGASGVIGSHYWPAAAPRSAHAAPSVPVQTQDRPTALPDVASVVQQYGPAVVNVSTKTRAGNQRGQPQMDENDMYEFFRRFIRILDHDTRGGDDRHPVRRRGDSARGRRQPGEDCRARVRSAGQFASGPVRHHRDEWFQRNGHR